MTSKVKEYLNRQSFQPDFISLFINPFFLIRRGLLKEIIKCAPHIKGIVLDFGCGRKPYKNLFTDCQLIGVDVENSGHPHLNSEIDCFYNGKSIPFESGYFDSVFSSEVLEHVFNTDEIIIEIRRVLKDGAIGLFTAPFVWSEHEIPYDNCRYTSYGFKNLFTKHGFEIIYYAKTGNFIEVIFQQLILYFHLITKRLHNKILITILNIIFITPITFMGLFLSAILPKNTDAYHNNVILVRKNVEQFTLIKNIAK